MPSTLDRLLQLEAAGRLDPKTQAGLDDARRRGLIEPGPAIQGTGALDPITITPFPRAEAAPPSSPLIDITAALPPTGIAVQEQQEQVEQNRSGLETGLRLSTRGLLNDVGLMMGSPAAEGFEVLAPNIINLGRMLFGDERGAELYNASLQQSRDISGIQADAKGFAQYAAEFGPGAMIPVPKVAAARIQNLEGLKRLIAEIGLPYNQFRTTGTVVTSAAIPPVLLSGVDAFIDNAQAQIDEVAQERSTQEVQAVVDEFVPLLPPQFIATPEERTETPASISAEQVSDDLRSDYGPRSPFDPNGVSPADVELDDFTYLTQGVLAAALITQLLGSRGRVGAGFIDDIRGFRSDPTIFSGSRNPREQITSFATKFEEALVDQMAPIVDAARRAIPQQFDQFIAQLKTTMTPGAMSSRLRNALKMGNLPNTHITIPSPVVWLETIARATATQRAAINDTLQAMNRLDLLLRDGIPFGRVTKEQMELRIRLATEDPLVAKMVDEYQEIMRGVRDYIHDSGRWSDETLARIKRTNNNFVPSQLDFGAQEKKFFDDFFESADDMFTKQEADFLKKRKGKIGPYEGLPPSQLLEPYIQQVVRAVENNRIRRQFLTAMEGSELFGSIIKRSSPNKFTTDVFIDGKKVSFQVGDDAIRRALQFNPRLIIPIANGAKRILVEWTTGVLNLGFVPISAAYEGGSAVMLRQDAQGIGLIDKMLKRAGRGPLPLDPSIIVSPITGPVMSGYANMMFAMGRNMEVSFRVNGPVTKLIGKKNAQRLARIGMRSYENSIANVFEQFGAGNAVFAPSREIEASATMLDKVAKGFFRQTSEAGFVVGRLRTLWGDYLHLATQLHNGIRMQSLAANVSPTDIQIAKVLRNRERARALERLDPVGFEIEKAAAKAARARLTKAAHDTRTVGGDTSQIGGGSVLGSGVQAFVSTTPYANVALQVLAEHARAFNRNPGRYAATMSGIIISGVGLMYGQFRDNPQAQDHYFNTLSATQRASFLPIYAPNSNRILFSIPMEHVFRPMWSPTIEMFGAVTGMKRGVAPDQLEEALMRGDLTSMFSLDLSEREVQDLKVGAQTGVLQALPVGVPTVIDMALVVAGKRAQPARIVTGQDVLRDISAETITSEQTRRTPGDLLPAQLQELLTALTGTGAGLMLSAANGLMREIADSEDITEGLKVGLERAGTAQLDRTEPIRALFSDLEFRITTNDANAQLFKAKMEGLKFVERLFTFDVSNRGVAGGAPGTRDPLPSGILPLDIGGTALELVLTSAAKIESNVLKDTQARLRDAFDAVTDVRRDPNFSSNPVFLRRTVNQIAMQIKGLFLGGVGLIQREEQEINKRLQEAGFEDVFRFDRFDADMADVLKNISIR